MLWEHSIWVLHNLSAWQLSTQPIPQHFCWDCGQQTFSTYENTSRSIRSTETQITPAFIFALVFHLLPESNPLFPLLSPDRQTEAMTPNFIHKSVQQGLDLWSASTRSLRWASHWMPIEHQKAKWLNNRYNWEQKHPQPRSFALSLSIYTVHISWV